MHKNTLYLVILCVLTTIAICLEAKKKKTVQQELLDLLKYIVRNKDDLATRTNPDQRVSFTDLTRSDGYDLAARKNNYNNKILVKRIIPHKIGEIDGNKRHYRPLFKIHDVPFVNDIFQNIINSRSTNDSPEAKPRLGTREDADGVRVFKIVEGRSHNRPKVGHGDSDDVLRHWSEAEMAEALEGLQVVPGHRPADDHLLPWNPNYPEWNYWTYYKTIYQDTCPGQHIKMGNICVRTPRH